MKNDLEMSGMVVTNKEYHRFYAIVAKNIISIIINVGFTIIMSYTLF